MKDLYFENERSFLKDYYGLKGAQYNADRRFSDEENALLEDVEGELIDLMKDRNATEYRGISELIINYTIKSNKYSFIFTCESTSVSIEDSEKEFLNHFKYIEYKES